jgi:excisionase family DNA binding protein
MINGREAVTSPSAQNGGTGLLGIEDKPGIAREVKCSPRTIDNLMARRAIPFIKIGRLVRFDVAKVKAALARFEVGAVGDRKGARQ